VFVEVDGPFGYSARVDLITDCNVKATAVHGGSGVVEGVLVCYDGGQKGTKNCDEMGIPVWAGDGGG
jgi:hypothetical protein